MAVSQRSDELQLVTFVDDTYLPFAWIVARSVAWQVRLQRAAILHVFHSGTNLALAARLARLRSWRLKVVVHPLRAELAHLARADAPIPPITYARLALPDLLPDLKRVLYLDADTLAVQNLAPLFDADLCGLPVAGVADIPQGRPPRMVNARQYKGPIADYYRDVLGIPFDPERLTYINAGVMLMDLDALRAEDFSARAIGMADTLADRAVWQDQDVINVVLYGRILLLDAKWNVIPSVLRGDIFGSDDVRQLIHRQREEQAIIHYAGGNKPWLRKDVAFARLWRFLAALSPLRIRDLGASR